MGGEVAEALPMGLWLWSGSCWDDGTLLEGQIWGSRKPPDAVSPSSAVCWEGTAAVPALPRAVSLRMTPAAAGTGPWLSRPGTYCILVVGPGTRGG